jgi:hypothetical protein
MKTTLADENWDSESNRQRGCLTQGSRKKTERHGPRSPNENLYLDGKPAASLQGRALTFTWEPSKAVIVLALSYIGLFDDLAVFNRALTDEEVAYLYGLQGGVGSLRP